VHKVHCALTTWLHSRHIWADLFPIWPVAIYCPRNQFASKSFRAIYFGLHYSKFATIMVVIRLLIGTDNVRNRLQSSSNFIRLTCQLKKSSQTIQPGSSSSGQVSNFFLFIDISP